MNLTDTIAAIASPQAVRGRGHAGSRGVLRIAGPSTRDLLGRFAHPAPQSRGAHRARWRLPGVPSEIRVPALILFYDAPRSYTGQDSAEIILPGNPHLLARALDAIVAAAEDTRLAAPGEFTARAYLCGRLTAEQAEGVGALIAASNTAEYDAAQRLLDGSAGHAYRALADEIAAVLALIEAELDFADEDDVTAITDADLTTRLRAIGERLRALGADREAGPSGESRAADPVVVIAGEPNAGKSTLFNALLGRPRSVVSDVRGTTRDAIAETLPMAADAWSPGPHAVTLVDLAGLDASLSAHGPIDAAAQHAALTAIAAADAVLWCDPSGRFQPGALPPVTAPVIRVRTKADQSQTPSTALDVCALDGRNLGALRRAIADAAHSSAAAGAIGVLPRHRRALASALFHIGEASRAPARELIGEHLRAALDAIGQIAGEISPDDVLGRIFASFCIGK